MSHIKTAALLDKAFKFMNTVKGTEKKELGAKIYQNRMAKVRLIEGQKNALRDNPTKNKALIKNLEEGKKKYDGEHAVLAPQYAAANKSTNKARAYLLGGTAAVGAVGAGVAVHTKKKKDNEILKRINQYPKHEEGYDG